ncbi:hypothetical protein BPT24_232 [Tenacibaculum phage pT24]|uniref:Uncharacterized protein n=1 Tax=Tenacibaculum phage pT24 TaxID=1880590 RepID=A0A1B4XX14_9CAUD|nr:hypothetical protein HYP10_gp296 [Tenacibaculum phage pT24]BAV39352.1 hypothetical protein BPT24_232 [Tenacibaculum phage pT24]
MKKQVKNVSEYLTEAMLSNHLLERLSGRVEKFNEVDLPKQKKQEILDNIENVSKLNFPSNKDYAVMVGYFSINQKSDLYVEEPTGKYYRIYDFLGVDSTGNQIWIIIRSGNIVSVMLRKGIQPVENMRVDVVVKNINKFIKNFKTGGSRGKKNRKK